MWIFFCPVLTCSHSISLMKTDFNIYIYTVNKMNDNAKCDLFQTMDEECG